MTSLRQRQSIAWVVTVPGAVKAFLIPHFRALARDYSITLYVNGSREDLGTDLPDTIEVVPVDLRREISPWRDIVALVTLFREFRRRRHAAVHSLLPKSGLLGMMAATVARVPCRFHTFTGQVWVNDRGARRWLLKALDGMVARLATDRITDSPSQRQYLIDQQVLGDANVFGKGSISGVDGNLFAPDEGKRAAQRAQLGLVPGQFTVGFLGRLNRDKGVHDLIRAFLAADLPDGARLVLAGPDEEGVEKAARQAFGERLTSVMFPGPTADPAAMLRAFDLFCLPSYREGFGSSALEASACALPVIASRIYGLTDAVQEGVTGWMHDPGDVEGLLIALSAAAADPPARAAFGAAGRARALRDFRAADLAEAQRAFYHQRLPIAERRA